MASYDKTIATAASLAASLMLVRGLANELLPSEVREALSAALNSLRSRLTWQHTIVVEEKEGWSYNYVYSAVEAYLATRVGAGANIGMQRLRVSSTESEAEKMVVSMEAGEEMRDVYEGAEFRWYLVTREVKGDPDSGAGAREVRSYEVSFHKRHKEKALKEYLPFIVATAKAIWDRERSLSIYMNQYSDEWNPMELQHPSTFETLAMDRKQKQSIIDDLDRFIKRKDYYRRIGKAWKRGYLLYGPPGTGKSSLIAAIANHLRFDIYDLELTGVNSNSDLTKLLIGMNNRSILVVEDVDCTIELKQREEHDEDEEHAKSNSTRNKSEDKVTLSGLLNFVDGLWSTSGEEKIIIFTTNYKERLDPALLRPGRMDMHIHMGYCTLEAFRILANNYHAIDSHATYPEIEELIKEVNLTPADVAEVLMRNDDTDAALHDLVELLNSKKKDATEIKTENKPANEKKDVNAIKTESMQVDEKKDGNEIKTESVQVEEKKDDKEVMLKNDSFTKDRSS
ncbi:hypothetical protein ACQ4PT_017249 [Festuca glaucescens]